MKSRLIAGTVAVLLAVIGGFLVLTYAQKADARAMAELEPVSVLVVQQNVPGGTPVEELSSFVSVQSLPATAVAATALADLESSADKVTAVELVPGEQLLAERLVDPAEAQSPGSVEVPEGLQEVSFQLEPQRVVGAQLSPGDHVGVFISMAGGALEDQPDLETTQLVVHKALVTAVQGAPIPDPDAPQDENAQPLPSGSLMITVAVDSEQATKIVFAAEFATLWLSNEPLDAAEGDAEIIQKTEVYR